MKNSANCCQNKKQFQETLIILQQENGHNAHGKIIVIKLASYTGWPKKVSHYQIIKKSY